METVSLAQFNCTKCNMKIKCHTNIDCARTLGWPTELPGEPQVNDLITSTSSTKNKCIQLKVTQRTWTFDELCNQWLLCLELHLPSWQYDIPSFEKFVKS